MDSPFKEIARLRTSNMVEVVLSEVYYDDKLTGYSLNKYVTTEEYTGFSKGVYIPEDLLIEFLKLFPQGDLQSALGLI